LKEMQPPTPPLPPLLMPLPLSLLPQNIRWIGRITPITE